MAKKSEQPDNDQVAQPQQLQEWQFTATQHSGGKWRWQCKSGLTGRCVSDGRSYTKLGRLLSSLVKFVKANEGWMAE